MSYKVEELLALRDSVSESAVSIEKFADEDVIKEHVLRPSASATLAAASSNKSLRSSATLALAPAAPNKKPSPSPSVKRGKAERLLKEHGSPPGMRVTAGGRVIPSDLPPLLNNRFANTTFKPPPLRSLTVNSTMSAQPRPDVNSVPRLEVLGSQPVLYVGDRAYALPALDASNGTSPSLVPSAETVAKPAASSGTLSAQGSFTGPPLAPPRVTTPNLFAGLDIATLKSQQTFKKQELRTVEQTEVLQASHQPDSWRAGIIEKKRNLIIELDALRKQISALENTDNNFPPAQTNSLSNNPGVMAGPTPTATFMPQFVQPLPSPMYGFPSTATYPPMMMYPPGFGGYPNMPSAEPAPFVQNPIQAPQSPGSASRRSHAIQIKPPPEENKKQAISALDPKSPTYEPIPKTTFNVKGVIPPTPSPAKQSPWHTDKVIQSDKYGNRTTSQEPSLSSIDTTDFFPTNTHEHSSTRVAPTMSDTKATTKENIAVPSTPDKTWPASPWNEGPSSRSSSKPLKKLTSWPEAFGKQPSNGSLKQAAAVQAPLSVQERFPVLPTEPLKSAYSNCTSSRKTADRRVGTEDVWPLVNSKPISHVPSTYQEGYQAGYDHVGIPDSPEVLKGYIQGLLQFLSDEGRKGTNNSLRGLVASSQPHDSAISMSYGRTDVPSAGSQENVRMPRNNTDGDRQKDSLYGATDDSTAYAPSKDPNQEARIRNFPGAMYMTLSGAPDKTSPIHRQVGLLAIEKDKGRRGSDKGTVSRAEAGLSGNVFRPFTGAQLTNHAYGTPLSMQRFCPAPNDDASAGLSGEVAAHGRYMTNQRLSGLDGAMDDLADMMLDSHIKEQGSQQGPPTRGVRSGGGATSSHESGEADASCFRPSSSKGKQKLNSSPTKSTAGERGDGSAPSPLETLGSAKKSGEHSPAKAKLEHVTNKFRRPKKDDVRNMSPEQKKERARKWRTRFQRLKEDEAKAIAEYKESIAGDEDQRR